MEYIKGQIAALDPKWVVFGVTFIATYLVADLLGLSVDDVVVDAGAVKVTWTTAIAFVSAQAASWWKSNIGTLLRTRQVSGNALPPGDKPLA